MLWLRLQFAWIAKIIRHRCRLAVFAFGVIFAILFELVCFVLFQNITIFAFSKDCPWAI
ncbi:MAG: hypothetical protein PUE05_06830 [bacterium]|nr:hypothetical protein [bacterium]